MPTVTQTQEIPAPAGTVSSFGAGASGKVIAQSGSWLAVNQDTGSAPQKVQLYNLVGGAWVSTQTLEKPAAIGADSFGASILFSADGTTLCIGEPATAGTRGSVYVYTLVAGVWTLQQTLQGTDGAITDFFGYNLAFVPGSGLLVTATRSTTGLSTATGNIYYYTLVAGSWTLQQKFTPSDISSGFGAQLSAGGSGGTGYLIANGTATGGFRVYIFALSGGAWSQLQEFAPSAGYSYTGNYGVFLTPTGKTAVIGGITTGSPWYEFAEVYSLTAGTFVFQTRLLHALDSFGDTEFYAYTGSLAGDDSALFIGASGVTAAVPNGVVYVYSAPSWTLTQTVNPDAANNPQTFGRALFGSSTNGWMFSGNEQNTGSGGTSVPPVSVFAVSGGGSGLPYYITLTFKGLKVFTA